MINTMRTYPFSILGFQVFETNFISNNDFYVLDKFNRAIYVKRIYSFIFQMEKDFEKALEICKEHAYQQVLNFLFIKEEEYKNGRIS